LLGFKNISVSVFYDSDKNAVLVSGTVAVTVLIYSGCSLWIGSEFKWYVGWTFNCSI